MADKKMDDAVLAKQVGAALVSLKEKMNDAKKAGLKIYFWGTDGNWPDDAEFNVEVTREYRV